MTEAERIRVDGETQAVLQKRGRMRVDAILRKKAKKKGTAK